MSGDSIRIGVDLGGTKIEVISLDGSGAELWRQRTPTPQGHYEATVEAVAALVERAERELGRTGSVGIGTPGSVSPTTGLHRNSNSVCLNGRPLHADLERRLGRRVPLANDANCFALSEAVDGAGAGCTAVFGVILGTGCGGGVVVRGEALDGQNLVTGEWGHNMLPGVSDEEARQRPCYCGRLGCVEQFISGPAVEKEYATIAGKSLQLQAISVAAAEGDRHAREVIDRFLSRLGRALAVVVNILDPDAIVLGGGASNLPEIYPVIQDRIRPWVFSDSFRTPVRKAVHGDSSGVRGAAWLGAGVVTA